MVGRWRPSGGRRAAARGRGPRPDARRIESAPLAGPPKPEEARTLSRDTAPWAERILCEHWRCLDSVAKLRIVSEHYLALQRLSMTGLALRYPDDSEEDLALRAACLRVGRDAVEHWTGRKLRW